MANKKWEKNDFSKVNVLCGLVFFVFTFVLIFSTYGAEITARVLRTLNQENTELESGEEQFDRVFDHNLLVANTTGTFSGIMLFFVGFFIFMFRENGFTNYTRYVRKYKKKIPPSFRQQILFYIFRNGSVIEECQDNVEMKYKKIRDILKDSNLTKKQVRFYKNILKKEKRVFFKWIQKSKDPVSTLRVIAEDINEKLPDENIYKNFTYSQIYQSFDTGLLFVFLLCLLFALTNSFLMVFSFSFPVIPPIVIGVVSFSLHRLSKIFSKYHANEYFAKIELLLEKYSELRKIYD